MNLARRFVALVLLVVLGLATVGCGVEATDGGSTGGGGDTTETTAPADTTPDATEPTDTTEPGDDSTTTEPDDTTDTTEGPSDTTVDDFGEFGKDSLIELYTDMGLSQEQASCLVDAIFDSATVGDFDATDQSAIFDYLATCEIDITDFGGTAGN